MYDKIRKWADDRNLNTSSVSKQFTKLFEEYGELGTAFMEADHDGIKDGIGDIAVVLTVMSHIQGLKIEDTLPMVEAPEASTYSRLGGVLANLRYSTFPVNYGAALSHLVKMTEHETPFTFMECLEHSYSQIANRKGTLVNGVFVKTE